MRRWSDPIVWSHVPIGVAAFMWLVGDAYLAGVALSASVFFSVLHHRAAEQSSRFRCWDYVAACFALAVTAAHFVFVASGGALFQAALILIAALVAKKIGSDGNYGVWHTLWHFLVAIGQAFMAWHWLASPNG